MFPKLLAIFFKYELNIELKVFIANRNREDCICAKPENEKRELEFLTILVAYCLQ